MSGYWDAVLGAALGLSGTAQPSSPAPFAADDDLPPLETEELTQAPGAETRPASFASAAPPVQVGAPQPAGPTASEARPYPPVEPLPVAAAAPPRPEEEPNSRRAAATETASDREIAHAEPRPAEPAGRTGAAAPTAHGIEIEASASFAISAADREERFELAPATDAAIPAAVVVEAPEPAAPAAPAEPILIAAEPVLPTLLPAEQAASEAPPPLTIEIGRIDIRILSPDPPPAAMATKREALPDSVPSLADYLARRNESGR